ncbi:MAG: hypothetical protein H6810_01645 [Phycisphaeraceae bacterium]|nr:MAG: hypothetical protein H6810_01645 [Phycisphaeraceae bacterium]
MATRRQLVLIRLEDPEDRASPTVPLGTEAEFCEAVAPFNIATDGGPAVLSGSTFFYGPGLVIEIVPIDGRVTQALVTCQDQDFAWPVLYGVCKANRWKLQDMESGRMFG